MANKHNLTNIIKPSTYNSLYARQHTRIALSIAVYKITDAHNLVKVLDIKNKIISYLIHDLYLYVIWILEQQGDDLEA